jgi:hypothetical protein
MTAIDIILLAAAGLAIARQFQARQLRPAALVAVPVVLVALGFGSLLHQPPAGAGAAMLFAASVALALVLGAWRGRSERLWRGADGALWRRATVATAALWAASIAARLLALAAARALGEHTPLGGQLEIFLGLSLAAQHAVLAVRGGALPRIAARA